MTVVFEKIYIFIYFELNSYFFLLRLPEIEVKIKEITEIRNSN